MGSAAVEGMATSDPLKPRRGQATASKVLKTTTKQNLLLRYRCTRAVTSLKMECWDSNNSWITSKTKTSWGWVAARNSNSNTRTILDRRWLQRWATKKCWAMVLCPTTTRYSQHWVRSIPRATWLSDSVLYIAQLLMQGLSMWITILKILENITNRCWQ